MDVRSLGLIETWGLTAAIEAADAGAKAANVSLVGYEMARGGLVTVKFTGDVAAVHAAVSAASVAAGKVGKVVSTHVIPRPHEQLHRLGFDGAPPAKRQPVADAPAEIAPMPDVSGQGDALPEPSAVVVETEPAPASAPSLAVEPPILAGAADSGSDEPIVSEPAVSESPEPQSPVVETQSIPEAAAEPAQPVPPPPAPSLPSTEVAPRALDRPTPTPTPTPAPKGPSGQPGKRARRQKPKNRP